MNIVLTLADLAGSVALLLWGIRMVQTGIQRALGAQLRRFLSHALRNRFKAFLAGIGVTAILQSSTATGLMVTGFAAGGLVGLVPALAVMLGANVGTTLIVQVLSFDVVAIAPVLEVVLAAVLTWAAHSSVAVVLLVMSFAGRGIVSPDAAFALVLGANLGTAINPVLEGATGDDPAARRLPFGNLLNRVIGVVIALIALETLTPLIMAVEPNSVRAVADFHTAFNLVLALVFFPLLGPYAALLRRWLPTRISPNDPSRPIYLDSSAREAPAVAVGDAAREALRMTDVLQGMLHGFRDALDKPDRRQIDEVKETDDILDKLNAAIKAYLISLDSAALTDADHRRIVEILTFATNIEQAGDIVDRNLLGLASKRLKRGLTFSPEGKADLLALADRLIANTRQAASLFMTGDMRAARALANEKQVFRDKEAAATAAHFDRLRAGRIETAETSALHLDLLRDLKQVNSHLVAAAAYPVLQHHKELLPNRLQMND